MKYYITNGNRFINAGTNRKGKSVVEGSSRKATRFKYSDGITYLLNNCKNEPAWSMQKIQNGKGYGNIITTANRFIGSSDSVTDKFENARQFDSVQEAKDYIHTHKYTCDSLKDVYIVDNTLTTYDYVTPTPRVQIDKNVRRAVYDRSGGKCKICGKPLSYNDFTVDHVVPLARGGENKMNNYQCTCHECNMIKGSRLEGEMYDGIATILSNKFYYEPVSEQANTIIRGIVRGFLAQYGSVS